MGYIFEDLKKYFEYDNSRKFQGQINSLIKRKINPLVLDVDFKIGSNNQRIYFPSAISKMEKVFKKKVVNQKLIDSKKFREKFKFHKYENL